MITSISCAICQQSFPVREEDRLFYEKISPEFGGKKFLIPPPRLCPMHREQRRLTFRNERKLYRRKSTLSHREIISVFHPDESFPVFAHDEWWTRMEPRTRHECNECPTPAFLSQHQRCALSFNPNQTFFEQFKALSRVVPRPPLINNKAVNSEFCNFADGNKNCYLLTSANGNEDCYYGMLLVKNKNVVDALWCTNSELLYEAIDCHGCYHLRYAQNCDHCSDSAFLLNCKGVKNSLFCVNLRNRDYYLWNRPSTKEEIEKIKKEMAGSYAKHQEMLARFEVLKKTFPFREAHHWVSCEDVSGDSIFNSKNIHLGFDIYDSRDLAYVHDGLTAKDCQDVCFFDKTELCYESTSLIGYGYRFTNFCRDSYNLFYCDNCHSCKNCFGCVGLRNREYCVLNVELGKDEYEKKVAEVIGAMEKTGEWGEFFPMSLSPFAYNETLAQDHFPLTKEQALGLGLKWREDTETHSKTVTVIPDSIRDISDEILTQTLTCEKTGRPYRLTPQELRFYRQMDLPLPRLAPETRHEQRQSQRNPTHHSRSDSGVSSPSRISPAPAECALPNFFRLWSRACAVCGKALITSYAPDRWEKVCCEECYKKEVY
ncbi:MAG: hypothetical protein WC882_00870 [Candidatus Gracilibacteria bacterium]